MSCCCGQSLKKKKENREIRPKHPTPPRAKQKNRSFLSFGQSFSSNRTDGNACSSTAGPRRGSDVAPLTSCSPTAANKAAERSTDLLPDLSGWISCRFLSQLVCTKKRIMRWIFAKTSQRGVSQCVSLLLLFLVVVTTLDTRMLLAKQGRRRNHVAEQARTETDDTSATWWSET